MAHRNDRAAGRDRAHTKDPIRPEPFPMLHHAGGELRELSEDELTGLTGGVTNLMDACCRGYHVPEVTIAI